MNPFPRIRVIRPEPPALLRLPVLLFIFAGAYALYDAGDFYLPLWSQQLFPQGIAWAAGSALDHVSNEYELDDKSWAIPLKDYERGNGICHRLLPGPADAPLATSQGDNQPFALPIKAPAGANGKLTAISCEQEKQEKFTATLAPRAEAQVLRAPKNSLGLELSDGSLDLKVEPGAELQLLMPNGRMVLSAPKGFTGTLKRDEQSITLTVADGEVNAAPELALHYRDAAVAWQVSAEAKGKILLAGQKPISAGKTARILPSGIYEIP